MGGINLGFTGLIRLEPYSFEIEGAFYFAYTVNTKHAPFCIIKLKEKSQVTCYVSSRHGF